MIKMRIDCPICGHFAHRKNACKGGMGDYCACGYEMVTEGKMEYEKYKEGDCVTVHSLGSSVPDKEYRAMVRGISMEGIMTFYIVEMIDRFISSIYPYSCCTFPASCLRKGWPVVEPCSGCGAMQGENHTFDCPETPMEKTS